MQDSPQLKQLHQSIVDSFDMEGLKDLCVLHLNIHFDELGRGGWSETVRELLLYVGRNGRFPDLLHTLAEHRPHISWPDPAQLPIAAWALDPFRRRDFYQHINLPAYYVPRPELLDQLRQALLTDPNDMALVSGVQMNALHGMGSIGKSVMARALCEDSAVQAAFPDGILWATVGQQPDLIPRLREWVEQLGGEYHPKRSHR